MKAVAAMAMLLLILSGDDAPQTKIGDAVRLGGLEFTALAVELRRVSIKQPGWPSAKVVQSDDKYTVLTYRVVNVTDVQVIDPGEAPGQMEDQYGNVHKIVRGEDICENCELVEPNRPNELLPGNSRDLVAIFQAPKIKKAELFHIRLSFVIDNRGTKAETVVLFEKSELGSGK